MPFFLSLLSPVVTRTNILNTSFEVLYLKTSYFLLFHYSLYVCLSVMNILFRCNLSDYYLIIIHRPV